MKTITAEEMKGRYGGVSTTRFEVSPERKLFAAIKDSISKRGEENANLLSQAGTGGGVSTGLKVAANTAGAIGDVAGETISRIPVVGSLVKRAGSAIGKGFNALTEKLSDTKLFGEAAAGLEEGNALEKGLSAAESAGEVAGTVAGADVGAGAVTATKDAAKVAAAKASEIPLPDVAGASKYVKGAIRDVVPTSQRVIDHQIAKALDLTPGDLSKIESSTGNQVGKFLSDNNLIGTNKASTQALIQKFFKENYENVRKEISKVDKTYKTENIPRFAETLKTIYGETQGKLGLEKVNGEITTLLKKKDISLSDIQRVKELLDDHFSLYKVSGDVAQGTSKEGLANVRTELKSLIENEVEKNTGADIRQMNNSVATSKSLGDAITTRSPRGLTRANLTTRDAMMGLGLTYFGSPLLGVAAILIGKIATSPTARLRFARFLDSKTDAYRKKVSEDLDKGQVPPEIREAVGI